MSIKRNVTEKPTQQTVSLVGKCYRSIEKLVHHLLFDTSLFGPIGVFLILCEAFLLELIIKKVPYTEIDYSTYMQQITQIESGELNYSRITGDTGPIVYPGGYVFIYSWMKKLTNGMEDLYRGQEAFRLLYLVSLGMTFLIYIQCIGKKRVQPIALYLLVISKRLHSIYVLRLFNDCFTTFFMLGTILLLQIASRFKKRAYDADVQNRGEMSLYCNLVTLLAIDCYCVGLSVKMNALLYLPGLLIIVYFLNDENALKTVGMICFGVFVMIGTNILFLANGKDVRDAFLSNAFDFKRQFLYKWSVNWKFISEADFLSDRFHQLLLAGHVVVLMIFVFKKWITPSMTGKSLSTLILGDGILRFFYSTLSGQNRIVLHEESEYNIAKIMMLSNLVGVLFARSLHYQFLSWYYYSMPFLMLDAIGTVWVVVPLLFLHEWGWNVYPSTWASSLAVVTVLASVAIAELCPERKHVLVPDSSKVVAGKQE